MTKSIRCFAAAAFAAATIGSAQAKMVHYEINGQRYSYSTNNRAQVEEARKRISAANATDAARTKAEAERRANPLVRVLGSQTQREATAAEERLKQLLGAPAAAPAAEPPSTARAARGERKQAAAARRQERRSQVAARREPLEAKPERPAARAAKAAPKREAKLPPAALREVPAAPTVQSVHFDPDTGIKTVHMSDGTVHEEPFEMSARAAGEKDQTSLGAAAAKPEDTTSALQKTPQN
jgi:hypothetical protein